MTSKAVIGLGFGDEGKGLTTNFLCLQNPDALVVRYSGGQQAGHTVVLDGKRHVFSNFGSGTLNGNPTYWSRFCTLDPFGLYNEMQILLKLGAVPFIYIDGKCPITTPMDKELNQSNKNNLSDGTCGVGVGATLYREEKFFSLLFEDLFSPSVLDIKLKIFRERMPEVSDEQIDVFKHCVKYITEHRNIKLTYGIPKNNGIIFEGSQGLLLDQHYGFFPHVTRSNTGSVNIAELGYIPEFFCITRAYQTRHGNGPMTNEDIEHKFNLNPLETNVFNDFQGKFKVSLLDLDLLEYGIMKDSLISRHRDNLVITCLDQVKDDLRFTYQGGTYHATKANTFCLAINEILKFKHVWISDSDESHNLKQIL